MKKIAFTGSRRVTEAQTKQVWQRLLKLPRDCQWHVGDADGVDKLVRIFAQEFEIDLVIHHITSYERWAFAERSQRMVKAIAQPGNLLIAFPNKPCPEKCLPKKPFSGHGSGTWGTIAFAKRKGLAIDISPIKVISKFPNWLLADIPEIPTPEPIQPQPVIHIPKPQREPIQLSLPLFG